MTENTKFVINSSPSSAAYLRQCTGSALVPIMACRQFGLLSDNRPIVEADIRMPSDDFSSTFREYIITPIDNHASKGSRLMDLIRKWIIWWMTGTHRRFDKSPTTVPASRDRLKEIICIKKNYSLHWNLNSVLVSLMWQRRCSNHRSTLSILFTLINAVNQQKMSNFWLANSTAANQSGLHHKCVWDHVFEICFKYKVTYCSWLISECHLYHDLYGKWERCIILFAYLWTVFDPLQLTPLKFIAHKK